MPTQTHQYTDILNELPAELQPELANFLISLADNKQFLGMRYAEWSDGGPTLEASVSAAAMAQDELGHARSLHAVLRDLPQVPSEVYEKDLERDEYRQITFLTQPLARWTDLIAVNFLFDTALTLLFEAARDSSFSPLRQRSRKLVEEERFHHIYGRDWFRRLAKAAPGTHAALQEATDDLWVEVLCWYGPPDGDVDRFHGQGILDGDAQALRQRLLDRVMPVLEEVDIQPLLSFQRDGDAWVADGSLPWSDWDQTNRRLG
ncbi:MAG: Phenylacetic acid catabolic protein [Anaerolineae bacterium]